MLQAKQQGLVPRCLAVITPGNPTGQVIEQDNQEELIKFAKDHDLVIIADEVYQVGCVGPGLISGRVTARSESTADGMHLAVPICAEGTAAPLRITQLQHMGVPVAACQHLSWAEAHTTHQHHSLLPLPRAARAGLPSQVLSFSRHRTARLVALAADVMMPGPLTWHCC